MTTAHTHGPASTGGDRGLVSAALPYGATVEIEPSATGVVRRDPRPLHRTLVRPADRGGDIAAGKREESQ